MASVKGIVVIVAGFCLHLTLGSGFSVGNMATYIISYLQFIGVRTFFKDSIWIFAMIVFGQGLLMSVSGILERKIGPRLTTLIGSAIASSGVAITYFTINTSLPMIIISYGLIFGLGISIAYMSPLTTAMKWFPNRKGLVNGILVGGFGLGSFIFTQVQTFYINPENSKVNDEGFFTDESLLHRIPNAFLVLAVIYSIIQLISCILLKSPETCTVEPEEINLKVKSPSANDIECIKYSKNIIEENIPNEDKKKIELKIDYTPLEMLKCRQFYILWFTFFFNEPIIVFLPSMYKAFGQTFINDDKYLAMVGSVAAIFNAAGRIIWGWIIDKTNYKVCMLALTIIVSVFVSTLCFTPNVSRIMYTIWIWVINFAFAGNFALLPTCTANTFGLKNASVNYGLVISAPCSALITQILSPIVGWNGMFFIIAACSSLSTVLTLLFKPIN